MLTGRLGARDARHEWAEFFRREFGGSFAGGLHGATLFLFRSGREKKRRAGTLRVCSFLAGMNGNPLAVTSPVIGSGTVVAAGFYSTTCLLLKAGEFNQSAPWCANLKSSLDQNTTANGERRTAARLFTVVP